MAEIRDHLEKLLRNPELLTKHEPGHAAVFAVGDIHSIEYGDDTFFIRVTGGDVETKGTLRFDVDEKAVEIANRAQGQR